MTIKEFIEELSRLDQKLPVCGMSETAAWDIKPEELEPINHLRVESGETHPRALVLGYKHY